MKTFNFILLLLVACGFADSDVKPSICTPEAIKKDDCNTCTCSQDGMAWICTKKACLKPVCKPGTSKSQGCNTCFCSENGMGWICTKMACPLPLCKPGTTKTQDCNTCICSNGRWTCTLKPCG